MTKSLWRTNDWKVLAKDRLYPYWCDKCPCSNCVTEVDQLLADAREHGWEVLGPGLLYSRYMSMVGPEQWLCSPWHAIEAPTACYMCCLEHGRLVDGNFGDAFHFISCQCSRQITYKDVYARDLATGDVVDIFACENWHKFVPYDIPCDCIDPREVLLDHPDMFGIVDMGNDCDLTDILIGGMPQVTVTSLLQGFGDTPQGALYGPESLYFTRAGLDAPATFDSYQILGLPTATAGLDWRNSYSSFDVVGLTIDHKVTVYYHNGRYNKSSYTLDTTNARSLDPDKMNWCHEDYEFSWGD